MGEPLCKVLQVVPHVFVREEFDLADPPTFRRAIPSADDDARPGVLADLSRHLDVVRVSRLCCLVQDTACDRRFTACESQSKWPFAHATSVVRPELR